MRWIIEALRRRSFVAYFYCNGADISLGIHLCLIGGPFVQIDVPFGFVRIGFFKDAWDGGPDLGDRAGNLFLYRSFGYNADLSPTIHLSSDHALALWLPAFQDLWSRESRSSGSGSAATPDRPDTP